MFCSFAVEVLRIIAETVCFLCQMTNNYCRDLWRRRIRAKAAQKHVKTLAMKFPSFVCSLMSLRCSQIKEQQPLVVFAVKVVFITVNRRCFSLSGWLSRPTEQQAIHLGHESHDVPVLGRATLEDKRVRRPRIVVLTASDGLLVGLVGLVGWLVDWFGGWLLGWLVT